MTKEDNGDTLKVLDKVLTWATVASTDPQKFLSEVKAEHVNTGWIERLQRKLQSIGERSDGTTHEVGQIQQRVVSIEKKRRAEVKL